MSEATQRVSPLAGIVLQGRFGAGRSSPGIFLGVRHPVSIVMAIARSGQSERLATALSRLEEITVQWAGADQYYLSAEGWAEGALLRQMKDQFTNIAALSDQSHGRIVIRVSGPMARRLLAKGTPVDLHEDEFLLGRCAVTQMAHVGVHLWHSKKDTFELSVFRGFAESFWEWLTTQAEEFGYQVN